MSLAKINTTNDSDVSVECGTKQTITSRPIRARPATRRPGSTPPPRTSITPRMTAVNSRALRRYTLADGQQEDVEKADWDIVDSDVLP